MLNDQYWHGIAVSAWGIKIWGAESITSHFLHNKNRTPIAFAERVAKLLHGRWFQSDNGMRLNAEERKIFLEAISLERQIYQWIKRRSSYFDFMSQVYTDERREYYTHTEWVVELLANFLSDLNIDRENLLVVLVIGLFHDGIEDASVEMKKKIVEFLKKHFPTKYSEIIETLFALSHPKIDTFHRENKAIFLPEGTDSEKRIESWIYMSNNLADAIHLDILRWSQPLFSYWRSGLGTAHTLPFRAPKDDGTFWAFIANELGEEGSPSNYLNTVHGFDIRRIRLLYRYVMHAYHIWWLQHGKPLSMMQEEKFFERVEWDLASMIQVSFYSVRRPTQDGENQSQATLAEQLTIPLKFCDIVYNAWDNRYLHNEVKDREVRIFKTMMLSFRARYYQELVMQVLGQNGSFHNLMRTTTEWLDTTILQPVSHEVLGTEEGSL